MTVEAAKLLEADLDDAAAREALRTVTIPACPAVIVALLDESRREALDFQRVTQLIAGDVALAAAVLKTANSPFFALSRKTHSIQQAVTVLGLRNLLKIVYGVALRQSLRPAAAGLEHFWEHSAYNSWMSASLARRWPGVSADDAYTFGLFRDAGMAVLAQQHSDYAHVVGAATSAGVRVVEAEQAHYGSAHPLLGALLARGWYLSDTTVWAIRRHHDAAVFQGLPSGIEREGALLVAVGRLAEHLVARFLNHADDADWETMGEQAVALLGLEDVQLESLFASMQAEFDDIRSTRPL